MRVTEDMAVMNIQYGDHQAPNCEKEKKKNWRILLRGVTVE